MKLMWCHDANLTWPLSPFGNLKCQKPQVDLSELAAFSGLQENAGADSRRLNFGRTIKFNILTFNKTSLHKN